MKRVLAGAAGLVLAAAAPAAATTVPLIDLPPGTKTATLGGSTATIHGSFDVAGWGWAEGYTMGLAGGFDYATPTARDTNTMVALRVARRMGGVWPFSWGLMASAGANLVDPSQPLPNPTSQKFGAQVLPWFQPGVVVSATLDDRKLWVRGTFGPVLGRFTEGTLLMPWLVPNLEVAYRFTPAWELVFGGGYASPYGVALRAAF